MISDAERVFNYEPQKFVCLSCKDILCLLHVIGRSGVWIAHYECVMCDVHVLHHIVARKLSYPLYKGGHGELIVNDTDSLVLGGAE